MAKIRQSVAIVITELATAHGRNITPGVLMLWDAALKDLDDDEIAETAAKGFAVWKDMPSAPEFLEVAGKASPKISGEGLALRAWAGVRHAIGLYGRYRSVDFGPQANAAIHTIGGWQALCLRSEGEDLDTWAKKEFVAAYVASVGIDPQCEPAGYQPGVHELENRSRGWGEEPVHRFDPVECKPLPAKKPLTALPAPAAQAELPPSAEGREAVRRALSLVIGKHGRKPAAGPPPEAQGVPRRSGSEG